VSRISPDKYTGEKPPAVRPGAMDAFAIPSLHQGELVERRPPMLMGSAA
jgi:hypothetical protein